MNKMHGLRAIQVIDAKNSKITMVLDKGLILYYILDDALLDDKHKLFAVVDTKNTSMGELHELFLQMRAGFVIKTKKPKNFILRFYSFVIDKMLENMR